MSQEHLTQGHSGGASRTKKSGNHLDQGPKGAGKKGKSIPQKGGAIPANVLDGSSRAGDNLAQHPGVKTYQSSVRGGGTIHGHDRVSPTAGRKKAGNHLEQHPSLTSKSKGTGQTYLGQ